MLASITPLGERGRGSIWGVTVVAFALGATASGLATGALCGALGGLLLPRGFGTASRFALLALACAAACVCDARRPTAPGPRRQVDERWLDAVRGWVYGLGFGAQLGVGVATRVTSAATYVAMLAAGLSGSAAGGAAVLGTLGLVRGLTPLLAARVRTPPGLLGLHAALLRWQPASRRLAVAGLAGAGLSACIGALA